MSAIRHEEQGAVMISLLVFLMLASVRAAIEMPDLLAESEQGRESLIEHKLGEAALAAEEIYIVKGSFPDTEEELGEGINGKQPTRTDAAPVLTPMSMSPLLASPAPVSPAPAASTDAKLATEIPQPTDHGDRITLRLHGRDGVLGTADDPITTRTNELAVRARTRNRLRLLRARTYLSSYLTPATMGSMERTLLRRLLLGRAKRLRRVRYVEAADRLALLADIAAIEAGIDGLLAGHLRTAMPANASGPGGLMAGLGIPENMDRDGFSRGYGMDRYGLRCRGRDGSSGNQDDF